MEVNGQSHMLRFCFACATIIATLPPHVRQTGGNRSGASIPGTRHHCSLSTLQHNTFVVYIQYTLLKLV